SIKTTPATETKANSPPGPRDGIQMLPQSACKCGETIVLAVVGQYSGRLPFLNISLLSYLQDATTTVLRYSQPKVAMCRRRSTKASCAIPSTPNLTVGCSKKPSNHGNRPIQSKSLNPGGFSS
ncbi:hypothetical protein TorRG33x02_348730, partial [Trema orientale]